MLRRYSVLPLACGHFDCFGVVFKALLISFEVWTFFFFKAVYHFPVVSLQPLLPVALPFSFNTPRCLLFFLPLLLSFSLSAALTV